MLFASVHPAAYLRAQSMDDLNLQVHGYATQGFLYSNQNSWNGTDSQNGSAAWTEAVVNLSVQPQSKLRVGVQARYFLLGDYGDQIALDWAQIDYKFNDRLGFRVGDVKTPSGMLNETQDIDPAHLWALLPQSVYPIASRDSLLDHFGGVVYGAFPLGERFGKLEYQGYGGERVIGGSDGLFTQLNALGFTLPNGTRGPTYGAALIWRTPLPGLKIGASWEYDHETGELNTNQMQGTLEDGPIRIPYLYGQYERGHLMIGGEYTRAALNSTSRFPNLPAFVNPIDSRSFYVMSSYKVTSKFTAGAYYSYSINLKAPVSSSRFQKDWTISTRYDFNPYLYAKAEQHFINGTATGFEASDNPNLQPTTRMTILKLGVSF
jgi:hypothetical protein